MENTEKSEERISSGKLNINKINEINEISEEESNKFIGMINNYKIKEIKNFLLDKPEIWKYNCKPSEETVIHKSIKANDISIISQIFKYCHNNLSPEDFKNLINKKNMQGVTALHYASFLGKVDIIKYLINFGADVQTLTSRKLNVYHYAAQGNQPNSLLYFYLFHKDKINFESEDIGGSTPLHWASYSSAVEITMYLLNYGANINKKDKKGNTPLHMAVLKNSYKMVQKLLQNGARTDIKNNDGSTPKDLAFKNNLEDIFNMLNDSEKCQMCNLKAPIRKETKSIKNIIIAYVFQIIILIVFFCFIFPYMILNENSKILYWSFFLVYIILTMLFFIIHIKLICTNPGRPKKKLTFESIKQIMKKKEVKINFFNYCPKCIIRRSRRVKHCSICDECCEGFDHHCYWVNNCIGINNYKSFIFFLFLSFVDVIFILAISIFSLIYSFLKKDKIKPFNDIKCKDYLNIKKFPVCFLFSGEKTIKIILNIIVILSGFFFFIPILLLVIIHSKNIKERNKKKKNRTSSAVSNSNDDLYLLGDIDSNQEYSITDFNSN